MWHRFHLLCWSLLVLLLGYSFGIHSIQKQKATVQSAITLTKRDTHKGVPTVYVQEINDSNIVGSVGTGARLVIGDEVVLPALDGSFQIPAAPFLVRLIDIPIPRGAQFVASKRGSNYYPIDSSSAKRLVPQNRIYFRSAVEAEAIGYKRGR